MDAELIKLIVFCAPIVAYLVYLGLKKLNENREAELRHLRWEKEKKEKEKKLDEARKKYAPYLHQLTDYFTNLNTPIIITKNVVFNRNYTPGAPFTNEGACYYRSGETNIRFVLFNKKEIKYIHFNCFLQNAVGDAVEIYNGTYDITFTETGPIHSINLDSELFEITIESTGRFAIYATFKRYDLVWKTKINYYGKTNVSLKIKNVRIIYMDNSEENFSENEVMWNSINSVNPYPKDDIDITTFNQDRWY